MHQKGTDRADLNDESHIVPADESNVVPADEIEPIEAVDEEPLVLAIEPDHESDFAKPMVRKPAGAGANLRAVDFSRPVNLNGCGATRVRIFHSRIALEPLDNMEKRINEWIDGQDIEVKHIGQSIAVMEGKSARPNLVVTLWY